MLGALERMTQHLTAAVVSNDIAFQQKVRALRPLLFTTAQRMYRF